MQCTRAILSAVPSPALRYFSTLSHTRHNFRKKFIENKLCFVIFSITFSAIFLILRIIKRDMIINVQKSRKYYIFSVCVCCFRYPACNALAPYCRLCPLQLYGIFPHYLIHDTIFERNLLKINCVL